MKQKVLLISYNYAPEPTGIGKYNGEMMRWLAQRGYQCTVLTGYPYYPHWRVSDEYQPTRYWYQTEHEPFPSGGSITVHRCPMYVPARPTGLGRILLDFSFLLSAFFKLLVLLPRHSFSAVITVVPCFLVGLLGVFYKNLRSTRLLYHVQDLQIEAARDLRLIRSGRAIGLLFALERFILNRCDRVTCVGSGMARKIEAKTRNPVDLLVNAADLRGLCPLPDAPALKEQFGFAPTDRIFLYSGGIGEKQGLEHVLHAATSFRRQPDVKIVICGSGPYKIRLQTLAQGLELTNVHFLPLQDAAVLNSFLNMADVHLVIQKADASDLVMPSKFTSILSVGGLALVTANPGTSLHELVEQHGIGLVVPAEDPRALADAMQAALAGDHSAIRTRARRYAEAHLSIDQTMRYLEAFIPAPVAVPTSPDVEVLVPLSPRSVAYH
jgi:colanic acid biosynthesis glycosyl transferase WcaI